MQGAPSGRAQRGALHGVSTAYEPHPGAGSHYGKAQSRPWPFATTDRFSSELTRLSASRVSVLTSPACLRKPPAQVVLADTRGDNNSAAGKQPLRGNKQPLPRGTVGVGAFVMPNAPIDPRTPLAAYVVPLEDLEQVGAIIGGGCHLCV